MPFQGEERSLELIDALAPRMPRIKQRDKDLADQLRRAASSIGLNCAEARFSDPGNRRARLFTGGKRGCDAACAAASRRLALRHGRRRRARDGVGAEDCGDTLEDDEGVGGVAP